MNQEKLLEYMKEQETALGIPFTKHDSFPRLMNTLLTSNDEKKTMAAIAREEFEEGRAEGIKEGEERGEQKTLISLVRDGLLPAAEAAKRLSMSEKNFLSML